MVEKKYIVIAEQIRSDIDRGLYREGESIPPIRKLAEIYNVNPQTVNKATAYLASLGYLDARRGAGSTVLKPAAKQSRGRVFMLIDRFRERLFEDLNDVANYHGKDIYLSYLMETARRGLVSSFLVYDREEKKVPQGFAAEIEGAGGIIVQGALPECRLKVLAELDIPTVLINRRTQPGPGRFASVLIPNDRLHDMANYLVSLGHRKFLFALSGRFERTVVFEERLDTFRKALASCGLEPDAVEPFVFTEVLARDSELFAAAVADGKTAVVAFNDVSALGIYGLAARAGLVVPRDVTVVGFDDIAVAQISTPPLTTIHIDRKDVINHSFRLLDELSAGVSPMRLEYSVSAELVIRQSAFRTK